MTRFGTLARGLVALVLLATASLSASARTDPLPSWNDGPAKQAILDFVARATTEGGPDFVPPAERIAAFDQDGTLWVEQPLYTEFRFALDRVPEVVKAHPEFADKPAFQAVLSKDPERIRALGARELFEILLATMSGMTPGEFADAANAWLATARDPRWHKPYTELVYQPMEEVLALLRANGFKTFIATGGNVGFVTPYSDRVYGIPPA